MSCGITLRVKSLVSLEVQFLEMLTEVLQVLAGLRIEAGNGLEKLYVLLYSLLLHCTQRLSEPNLVQDDEITLV